MSAPQPRRFSVQILELISTTYVVTANSAEEAETLIEDQHHDDQQFRDLFSYAEIVWWQCSPAREEVQP